MAREGGQYERATISTMVLNKSPLSLDPVPIFVGHDDDQRSIKMLPQNFHGALERLLLCIGHFHMDFSFSFRFSEAILDFVHCLRPCI